MLWDSPPSRLQGKQGVGENWHLEIRKNAPTLATNKSAGVATQRSEGIKAGPPAACPLLQSGIYVFYYGIEIPKARLPRGGLLLEFIQQKFF